MLLIQNGLVFTMESKEESRVDQLIDKDKIIQIAKEITPTEGMRVIDAAGLRVYPGFR